MISEQQLRAAIAEADWSCCECGSAELGARLDCGEPIPDAGHFASAAWTCPALLAGSPAMVRCVDDILTALAEAGLPLASYGEVAVCSPLVAS